MAAPRRADHRRLRPAAERWFLGPAGDCGTGRRAAAYLSASPACALMAAITRFALARVMCTPS